MINHHKNRDPWKFFLLTFAYSWVIWIPSVLDGIGVKLPFSVEGYSIVVVIIGAFAPLLAAITLVVREEGWKGTRVFFRQALDIHIKPVFFVVIFTSSQYFLLLHWLCRY